MAKGKDSQKEVKKKSEKSLKEKRNEKKEKKSTFLSKQRLWASIYLQFNYIISFKFYTYFAVFNYI